MLLSGGIGLLFTALYNPTSHILICIIMAIFAAGGSLVLGIYVMKALVLFPEIKGTASSMMTAIRQLLASSLIFLSELFFDGTIVPIAIIIFAYMIIATFWYIALMPTHSFSLRKSVYPRDIFTNN